MSINKADKATSAKLREVVKQIVAIEHNATVKIAEKLRDLVAEGNTQRVIAEEWTRQAGKAISQATVAHYLAVLPLVEQGANADNALKAIQSNKVSVAKAKEKPAEVVAELDLGKAPKRKARSAPKAKGNGTTANPLEQVKAIRKAQEVAPKLSATDRAKLLEELRNWITALSA